MFAEAEELLRINYINAIDFIVNSISFRFDQPSLKTYSSLEQILLTKEISEETALVLDIYNEIHKLDLIEEFKLLCSIAEVPDSISTYQQFFKEFCNRVQFSNVYTLFKLVLILPATNATSERAFSSLKCTKTCLRNSMGQARLVSLMLLHENKEMTDGLDPQKLITQFVSCHDKRPQQIFAF